ncbi:hypothetical protein CCP4SC76_1850006 [Gammaproteobacteria bacterium]
MPSPRTHYETLQLSRDADAAAIYRAYRRLSQKYHPDKHAAGDQARYEPIQKRLNQAYAVLSDPRRRLEYDHQIHQIEAQDKALERPTRVTRPVSKLPTPGQAGYRYGNRYGIAAAILAFGMAVGLGRWYWGSAPPPAPPAGQAPHLPHHPPPPPAAPPPRRWGDYRGSPLPPPPRRFEKYPAFPQRPAQQRWPGDDAWNRVRP